MKIISYNINGINKMIKEGALKKFFDKFNADIYCFQELKIKDSE